MGLRASAGRRPPWPRPAPGLPRGPSPAMSTLPCPPHTQGIRTILVTDALGSSQPNSGQAMLDYLFRRFPAQLELATTDEVVKALQAQACAA